MPRLYLMRHADAGAAPEGGMDSDRRLTAEGGEAAARMGTWLAERLDAEARTLDHVVFSGVARTQDTLNRVTPALEPMPEARADRRIYDATTGGLLVVLAGVPEGAQTALLIGHNPGLEGLLAGLTDQPLRAYPTAGIAELELDSDWGALGPGSAQLTAFAAPHMLG